MGRGAELLEDLGREDDLLHESEEFEAVHVESSWDSDGREERSKAVFPRSWLMAMIDSSTSRRACTCRC